MRYTMLAMSCAAACACSAHANLTFEWLFFDTEVAVRDIDGPLAENVGEQVMNYPMGPWDNYASAGHPKAGDGVAEIDADASVSICGIYNIWADASVAITAFDPGPVGMSTVHTYISMQLAVYVTDTAYVFDHIEQIDTLEGEGITQSEHSFHTTAETILLPREAPYLVMWAALDYTAEATFNTGPIDGVAGTRVDMKFNPIPEPMTVSMLALGLFSARRRRR